MRRAVFTGLALAVVAVGCGQPVTVDAPGTQTPSVESTAPTSLASLDVTAVGEAYPQVWTFLGEDAATHENVMTREPMFTGFVRQWFADSAGGVLVGRGSDYFVDAKSGLVRLTSDGAVADVLPVDEELYAELAGVGIVDGRPAAVMAELLIGEDPDAWVVTAYDIESGEPLVTSVGDIGVSREVSVVAAAVSDDAVAYAIGPSPSSGNDEGRRVVVEVGDQVTEVWSSDDRFVTGMTYGPGKNGPRLYVVTAPLPPGSGEILLLVYDDTEQVSEISLPGWGVVDEDWLHLPTRLSADDRYVMVAGEPVSRLVGLVNYEDAPPTPVSLFEPTTDRWMSLDVTGAWSLRGPRAAS